MEHMSIAATRTASRQAGAACASQYAASSAVRAGLHVDDLQAFHAEQRRRRILKHDARGFLLIMNP